MVAEEGTLIRRKRPEAACVIHESECTALNGNGSTLTKQLGRANENGRRHPQSIGIALSRSRRRSAQSHHCNRSCSNLGRDARHCSMLTEWLSLCGSTS